MLQIQTANLPPEQQHRLDPEFLANEQVYLHLRDSLLPQYRGVRKAESDYAAAVELGRGDQPFHDER